MNGESEGGGDIVGGASMTRRGLCGFLGLRGEGVVKVGLGLGLGLDLGIGLLGFGFRVLEREGEGEDERGEVDLVKKEVI